MQDPGGTEAAILKPSRFQYRHNMREDGEKEGEEREENEEGDDDERSEELNAEFGDTDNRSLLFADDAIEGQLIEGAESSFFRCFVQVLCKLNLSI